MATIRDLMVTDMITAKPDETVAVAAGRMCANRVGAVLLVRDGTLRGLFSERDLLTRVVGEARDPATTGLEAVATADVVTIDVGTPIRTVAALLREKRFRHLPVLEDGKPVGILSTRDFLDYVVEGLERYIDDMKYKRDLAAGIDPYDHIGGSYGR